MTPDDAEKPAPLAAGSTRMRRELSEGQRKVENVLPVAVCQRTSRHQGQQLHLAVRRFGEALLATVPPKVRQWAGVREPVADLQRSCTKCGAALRT